jgi:uncharacterized membrane protein
LPTSLIARARRPAIALAAAAVFMVGLVPTATAADSLTVTTPYPSIAVAPGSNASFDLTVTAPTAGTVDLSVKGAPTDWKATLHGGGFVVSSVTAAPGKAGTVRLDVDVPAATTTTKATLIVEASQGSSRASLEISVGVDAAVAGDIKVTTSSPTLTGSSDSPFTFDLTLQNGSAEDQTVSATATGPAGWVIDTKLSQANAASTIVKAGSSTTITVTATAPTGAPAGHTDLDVTVTAGTKTIPGKLGIDITGTFSLTLATPNDLVSAHGPAGSGTTQQVLVKNTGTGALTNVKMTSSAPTNWKVTFDQDTIPTIAANGGQATVTATITPTGEAVTGDYKVTLSAASAADPASGATAANGDLPMTFTVETSPIWLLAGFGLIVLILAGLFYVFRTYGRR